PLPPASRTVGQVVAEAIALYRSNFAWVLALGLPVALAEQGLSTGSIGARIALLAAASPAFSLAYAGACAIRQDEVPPLRTWVVALAVGVVTFLPAAFFFGWFLIVAILWLGRAATAAPAVMAEGLGVVGALRRTFQLGRADYVHAAGSFAALAILFGLTRSAPGLLRRRQVYATVQTAIFLADLVLSPLLFLGAAIVYVDLVARVGLTREDRRRLRQAALRRRAQALGRSREEATGGAVSDAHVPDGEGQADAQREPGQAARGEPRRRGARREGAPPVGVARRVRLRERRRGAGRADDGQALPRARRTREREVPDAAAAPGGRLPGRARGLDGEEAGRARGDRHRARGQVGRGLRRVVAARGDVVRRVGVKQR